MLIENAVTTNQFDLSIVEPLKGFDNIKLEKTDYFICNVSDFIKVRKTGNYCVILYDTAIYRQITPANRQYFETLPDGEYYFKGNFDFICSTHRVKEFTPEPQYKCMETLTPSQISYFKTAGYSGTVMYDSIAKRFFIMKRVSRILSTLYLYPELIPQNKEDISKNELSYIYLALFDGIFSERVSDRDTIPSSHHYTQAIPLIDKVSKEVPGIEEIKQFKMDALSSIIAATKAVETVTIYQIQFSQINMEKIKFAVVTLWDNLRIHIAGVWYPLFQIIKTMHIIDGVLVLEFMNETMERNYGHEVRLLLRSMNITQVDY